MMILNTQRSAVFAMLSAATAFSALSASTTNAFTPAAPRHAARLDPLGSSFLAQQRIVTGRQTSSMKGRGMSTTSLRMSSDDFNEQKYTEAGWAVVAALTKAADFHKTSTVESPILLDLLLNPSKHKAGDDAESARKAVEKVLKEVKCDVKALRQELETHLTQQPKMQGDAINQQKTMGYSLPKVLEAARNAMSTLGDSFVSAEALLLGLAKEDDRFTNKAFLKQDIKYTNIADAVIKFREKAGPIISRSAENNYDALLKYGVDFTEQAEEGKLDPVIGRDDEIRRAIQILSRRTKNNPVLIGDPGGK
jgi:ElaB/YqjD/DUF883 family membrane-anchored ribosome-binding protein